MQVGKLGARFCLNKKLFSSVEKCNLKKIILDCDVTMTSQTLLWDSAQKYNRSYQVDVCAPSVFEELIVETHVHADRTVP